ncbi:hypothetical protein AOQ84DRAFT_221043 [Glonium stellatum]|uniref:Uncharacterized protein n=1 Tax=Glonium stellatum TaxID=574774 RepID=A0A8E2F2S7_9PEZI|nr:hypothetical protein AOQ84DRAFT_221043 [Glonium stellatum]
MTAEVPEQRLLAHQKLREDSGWSRRNYFDLHMDLPERVLAVEQPEATHQEQRKNCQSTLTLPGTEPARDSLLGGVLPQRGVVLGGFCCKRMPPSSLVNLADAVANCVATLHSSNPFKARPAPPLHHLLPPHLLLTPPRPIDRAGQPGLLLSVDRVKPSAHFLPCHSLPNPVSTLYPFSACFVFSGGALCARLCSTAASSRLVQPRNIHHILIHGTWIVNTNLTVQGQQIAALPLAVQSAISTQLADRVAASIS